MHTPAEALLPLFRSRTQLLVLTDLYLTRATRTIAELVEVAQVDRTSILREVDRLAAAGIVERDTVGRTVVVRTRADLPWGPELEGILTKTMGVATRLEALLRSEPAVVAAYVFGSWADRWYGNSGPWPRDIDVVIVGDDLAPMALRGVLAELEPAIGVEINPVFATMDEWAAARQDTFLGAVAAGSLVTVKAPPDPGPRSASAPQGR